VVGSSRPGTPIAPDLPLARGEFRGRFSAPASGIQLWIPVVLSLLLLAVSGRGLMMLGPAFEQFRTRSSLQVQPFDRQQAAEVTAGRTSRLSPIFTPEIQRWAPSIERWAAENSLPSDLIAVIMQIESCGDPLAVSPAGAVGLFQVMPYHFSQGDDPFDAETNATRGLDYLAGGLRLASNDPGLALAGYNGGHSVIGLPASMWADETRRYVIWGEGILQEARAGLNSSPRLEAWLRAGGDRLCRLADSRLAQLPSAARPAQ